MPKPQTLPADVTCALFRGIRRRVVRTHYDTWADFTAHRLPELLASESDPPADDSAPAFDAAKLSLPAFVLAPIDRVRRDETTGAHTALVIDVDALPSTLKAFLRACAHYTCAVYESPSSGLHGPAEHRLRVVAALAAPLPPELVKAARRAFARDLGLDPAAAGVTKADAVSQIMFAGCVGGTPARRMWTYAGEVWNPPADLEAEVPRAVAAADGASGFNYPDREPDEMPPVPAELTAAIEPKAGRQRRGGRDLMRALGGYWARKGYHPEAVHAVALTIPSSQPEKRATEALEAAQQWFAGDERTAGANEVARHFADTLGETAGRTVLAALDDSYVPPRWAVRYAETALVTIKAGGERSSWRVGLIEWSGLRPAGSMRRKYASPKRDAARAENTEAIAEAAPGLDGLETDDDGRPFGTPDNIARCVRHFLGHALALDATTSTSVLLEPVRLSKDPSDALTAGPWQDGHTFRVRKALNRIRMKQAYDADTRQAIRDVASARTIDVLGDWLRGLAEQWDMRPRVDGALARYWRAEASALTSAVSRCMLLGIAARGLKPGCQLDTVPVLIGQQGCGKTTSLQALVWGRARNAPAEIGYGAEQRYNGSKLSIGSKDAVASIRGHLVWELAELASVKRTDIDEVKAWITQRWDKFRPPYAHEDVRYERTVAFIGNLNPERTGHVIVNRDATGGRRWLPVFVAPGYVTDDPSTHLEHRVDVASIERDSAQLLGEAARRVLDGEQWHPTDAEIEVIAPAVAAVSEDPVRDDPWYGPVRQYARREAKAGRAFTIAQVFTSALDMVDVAKHSRAEALRLAGVLRDLGFESKLSNGARRWARAGTDGST